MTNLSSASTLNDGDNLIRMVRIERVAQTIAQVIDGDDRDKDEQAGKNGNPWRNDHLRLGILEHIAPGGHGRLDTKAEKLDHATRCRRKIGR